MQEDRTLCKGLPTQPETEEDQQTKKLGVQRVPTINIITRNDINTAGFTQEKASLFKTKGEDGTSSVEIKDSINVKYSIIRGWTPFGHLNLKTTKGVYVNRVDSDYSRPV